MNTTPHQEMRKIVSGSQMMKAEAGKLLAKTGKKTFKFTNNIHPQML